MPQNITRSRRIDLRHGVGAIVLGTFLLALPGGAATVVAQPNGQVGRAAWCVDMANLGGYFECLYHTYDQCAAAARGVTNVCVKNSFYVPQPRSRARRDSQR